MALYLVNVYDCRRILALTIALSIGIFLIIIAVVFLWKRHSHGTRNEPEWLNLVMEVSIVPHTRLDPFLHKQVPSSSTAEVTRPRTWHKPEIPQALIPLKMFTS